MDFRQHTDPAVLEAYNLELEARYGLTHGVTTGYAAVISNLAGDMYALDVSAAIRLPGDPTGPLRLPEYFTTLDPADPLYLPWPEGSLPLDWETDLEGWNEPVINP